MKTVMEGVVEYCEGYDVETEISNPDPKYAKYTNPREPGREVIIAKNEGGHNTTRVDLLDVIDWVKKHRPELLETLVSKEPIEPSSARDLLEAMDSLQGSLEELRHLVNFATEDRKSNIVTHAKAVYADAEWVLRKAKGLQEENNELARG